AIATNVVDRSGHERSVDLAAVHTDLARESAQPRHRIESRACARLIHRQHVHEVEVTRMVSAEIAVESELAIVVAPIPKLRRDHAVDERAVVQHRQVEATSVPRYELRRVTIDAVEK